jgi:hypothetical protein
MKHLAIFSVLALLVCVSIASAGVDVPLKQTAVVPVNLANPVAQDLLWDQFDGTVTNAYTAQNFEAGFETFDNEMADDFTVPAGDPWTLEVLVYYGIYYNCGGAGQPPCGPTDSWDVTIYANTGGMPGAVVAGPYNIVATQVLDTLNQYFFELDFPAGVVLGPGTYWIGATANMAFGVGGQIGIGDNDMLHVSMARWRNPGNGFGTGCTAWGVAQTCFAAVPPSMTDYSWQLYGTAGDDAIPCEDIRNFTAICKPVNGRVQPKLTFFTTEHAGKTVTFLIDGVEADATVVSAGTRAIAKTGISGHEPGTYTVALVNPDGCFEEIMVTCIPPPGGTEEADEDADEVAFGGVNPAETALQGNYPNPFNPSTTIRYALSQDSWVSLKVFNTLGQEVATLVNEFQHAGSMAAVWNGRNEYGATVASGIYIYRLTTDNVVLSEKMLFMK